MSELPALELINTLYPNTKRVYGPYKNNYFRRFVILYKIDLSSQTISFPKLLLELHIGRKLEDNETCDHIDGNYYNDSIDNLRVLPREVNSSLGVSKEKLIVLNCTQCGKEFTRPVRIHKRNLRVKRTTWFCSKHCTGKYHN